MFNMETAKYKELREPCAYCERAVRNQRLSHRVWLADGSHVTFCNDQHWLRWHKSLAGRWTRLKVRARSIAQVDLDSLSSLTSNRDRNEDF